MRGLAVQLDRGLVLLIEHVSVFALAVAVRVGLPRPGRQAVRPLYVAHIAVLKNGMQARHVSGKQLG